MKEPGSVYERFSAWFDRIEGDYVTSEEVRAFIADERSDAGRAAELAAFADVLIYNALMQRAVSRRTSSTYEARRSVEAQQTRARLVSAAENIGHGKPSGLMAGYHKIDDKGTERRAAEMDGPAHLYVASRYASQSRRTGMFAAFHKAVAKKCGRRRTDEVFTAEQYEAMYHSIVTASRATDAA